MKILTSVTLLLAFTCVSFAQRRVPAFSSYASRVENLRNIQVKLDTRDARMFRTNLRNAAKGKVNFAGHFILTDWGCGTNCSESAIIDARTGKVYFPRELAGIGLGFCDLPKNAFPSDTPKYEEGDEYGLHFKPNSRLLVLAGFLGGGLDRPKEKCGVYSLEWTGTRFRQVKLVPGKRTETP